MVLNRYAASFCQVRPEALNRRMITDKIKYAN
jgi:hypothetical protein